MPLEVQLSEDGVPTVQVGEEVQEVVLPEEFVRKSEFEDYVPKSAVEHRIKSRLSRHRDSLMSDDDFVESLISAREDELRERFGSNEKGPDVEELRKSIHDSAVKPLEERLENMNGRLAKALERSFDADFLAATNGRLDPAKKGFSKLLRREMRDRVEWSDEFGAFLVKSKDGEGFAYSKNPTDQTPYMTVAELADEMASGDFADVFLDTGRGGGGGNPKGGPRGPRNVTLEKFEAMSPTERLELRNSDKETYDRLLEEKQTRAFDRLNSAVEGR